MYECNVSNIYTVSLYYSGILLRYFSWLVGMVGKTCGDFWQILCGCKDSKQALHCTNADNWSNDTNGVPIIKYACRYLRIQGWNLCD